MENNRNFQISIIGIILLSCFCLRFLIASLTPFWLDEIFSVDLVSHFDSILQVFTTKHDNNHILNSLFLYLAGDSSSYISYRLHNIIISIILLLVMLRICGFDSSSDNNRGRKYLDILTIGFLSSSFLMNVYSTEARGYSLLMLFSTLAFYYYRRVNNNVTSTGIIKLNLSLILGLLSQPAILFLILAFVISSLKNIKVLFSLVPAVVFMGVLYFVFYKGIDSAALPDTTLFKTMLSFFSLLSGGPSYTKYVNTEYYLSFAFALLSILSIAYSFYRFKSERIFILSLYLISPLLYVSIFGGTQLAERYFLSSAVIFYYYLARNCFDDNGRFLTKALPCVALVFLMNLYNSVDFIKNGRSQFNKIINLIPKENKAISIGGDYDFRIKRIYDFYAGRLDYSAFNYLENATKDPSQNPDYIISHHIDRNYQPIMVWKKGDKTYNLVGALPGSYLSSLSFYLYKRQDS